MPLLSLLLLVLFLVLFELLLLLVLVLAVLLFNGALLGLPEGIVGPGLVRTVPIHRHVCIQKMSRHVLYAFSVKPHAPLPTLSSP